MKLLGNNITTAAALLQRLSCIEHALSVLGDTTVSLCTVSTTDNGQHVTARLLDDVLDEALDAGISMVAQQQLRVEAATIMGELSALGINVSEEINNALMEGGEL